MNNVYKVYASMVNEQLKVTVDCLVGDEQVGFRKGQSCIDTVFVLKQISQK